METPPTEDAAAELARLHRVVDDLAGIYLFEQVQPGDGGPRWFRLASAGLTARFGVRPGDPARLIDRVHEDDRPRLAAAIEAAARASTPVRVDARVRDLEGRVRWLAMTASPSAPQPDGSRVWSGAFVDITERVRAEQALRATTERHELTLRAANDGLWDRDVATDRIEVSPRLVELLGLAGPHELATFDDFVARLHADDRPRVLAAIDAHLTGRAPYDEEFRLRRGDGAWRWFRARGQAAWDAAGRSVRVAGSLQDVTDRRATEEALREGERRFGLLAQATFEAIVLSERGVIVDANDQAGELLGCPASALVGRQAMEFVAPASRDRVRAAMAAGDEGPYEHELLRADGRAVLAEARARMLPYRGRTVRCTALRDISAQRAAQAALRESEAQYRDLYRRTPALMHSIDPEGRIVGVSDRWLETLGYTREEVLGRRSVDFLTPASRRYATEEVLPAFFVAGSCQDIEYQYLTKDGRTIDGLLSAIAERDAEGRLVRSNAVIVDVTERRRAEAAQRAGEARYRALIETAPDAILLLDPAGRVVDANARAAALLDRASAVGADLTAGLEPERAAALRERLRGAIGGAPQAFDWSLAGGQVVCEVRLVAFDAALARASLVDVTARRGAQAAIAEGQRRLAGLTGQAFLDGLVEELAIGLGVRWVIAARVASPGRARTVAMWADGALAPDLEYDLVGTPCATILGASLCVYGDGLQDRFPEDHLLRVMGAHSYMGAPMHASAGQPLGLVAVLHDAPREFDEAERSLLALYATRAGAELERMQAAEALERRVAERTAELAASNRELEAFSYAVSHDLRAPLRAINGFARALEEEWGPRLDAGGREHLARVLAGSERMGRLIDDLLGLSRVVRHELDRVAVDVGALARAALEELRRQHPGRSVTVEVEEGLAAEADPGLVRSLVVNLLDNAWKFTSRRPAARIRVDAGVDRGRRAFFVDDDGAGFDPGLVHRLFTPFQRLHSPKEFEGTGIGLATAQRIARRHGGDVWAEGRPEQGATFWFTLSPS